MPVRCTYNVEMTIRARTRDKAKNSRAVAEKCVFIILPDIYIQKNVVLINTDINNVGGKCNFNCLHLKTYTICIYDERCHMVMVATSVSQNKRKNNNVHKNRRKNKNYLKYVIGSQLVLDMQKSFAFYMYI